MAGQIAAAINGYYSGVDRRRELQRQAEKDAQNKQVFDINKEKADLEIKQLKFNQDKANSDKIKQDFYNAWDNQSLISMNNIIDNNPKAKKAFGVSNIKFFPLQGEATPSQLQELKNKGIKPENAYLGTQILPDGTAKEIVFDMNKKKMASGYLTYRAARDLKIADAKSRTEKAKALMRTPQEKVQAVVTQQKAIMDEINTISDPALKSKVEAILTPQEKALSKDQLLAKWAQDGDFGKIKKFTEATKIASPQGRMDTRQQLKASASDLSKAQEAYKNDPSSKNLQALKSAKDINTRLLAGQSQIREGSNVADSLSAKNMARSPEKFTPKARESAEVQFINTDEYRGTYKKPHQKFLDNVVAVRNTQRLKTQLDDLVKSGNYKSDVFKNLVNTVKKYTPSDWLRLSKMDVAKIALEAKIDKNTAGILKAISGTAASDAEYARTLGYTIGQIGYDEKTKQVIFNSSYDKFRNDTIEQGKLLVNAGMVGKVYDQVQAMESDTQEQPSKSLVGQTIDGPGGVKVTVLEVDANGNPTKYVKVQ